MKGEEFEDSPATVKIWDCQRRTSGSHWTQRGASVYIPASVAPRHWARMLAALQMNRAKIFLLAVIVVTVICGCERGRTYSSSDGFILRTNLVELTTNSVRVALALESDAQGLPVIRATFTPT